MFFLAGSLFMDFRSQESNIKILMSNYLSKDLPNDFFNYDIDNVIKIMEDIYNEKYSEIFTINNRSKLIEKINIAKEDTPSYIFNDGTEPIAYFDYKNNKRYREMSIPNFTFFISFVYNSILMFDEVYTVLYDNINHEISNTPILLKKNENVYFENIIYENGELISEVLDDYITEHFFVGKDEGEKTFNMNVINEIICEGTNLYYLETDIENFYSSIYTHDFENLFNLFSNDSNVSERKQYFKYLDYYNMKINKNHTKGILTGPISSRISSELLLINIDQIVQDELDEEISYMRYLDDMWFYSNQMSSLEKVQNKLQGILKNYNLDIQHEKTNIVKNIKKRNNGQISQVYNDFPFLKDDPDTIYNVTVSDLLHLNSLMSKNINDLSYWKTHLTVMSKKINKKEISFDQSILEAYLVMVIKFGFLYNPLQVRVYKLINSILKLDSTNNSEIIKKVLTSSFDTINNSYSDTIGQIWHYKLLLSFMNSREKKEIFDNLKNKYDELNKDINPLVLFYFIEKDNKNLNGKLFKYIRERCCISLGIDPSRNSFKNLPNGISYSKWFMLLVHLNKVGKYQDPRLDKLFIENKTEQKSKLYILQNVLLDTSSSEDTNIEDLLQDIGLIVDDEDLLF